MQKSERLNAAYRLIAQGIGMAEAAMMMVRDCSLSRRQAYRYLAEAQTMTRPAPVAEPSIAITFKLPASAVRDLRAYAAANGLTQSETVARAISCFLAQETGHG
jgi:predicted DNA-binding transcriptional regulator YafY